MTQFFEDVAYKISQRQITDEGYLLVPGQIARPGIQEYRAFQIPSLKGKSDPMKIVKVYRPAEEVFADESIKTMQNKPVTVGHTFVTSKNFKSVSVGFTTNARQEGNGLFADLLITDERGIKAVNDGKKQLSVGYDADIIIKDGVSPEGEQYDAIMMRIRGNHIALVDSARCGSACSLADSVVNNEGNTMHNTVLDGKTYEVEDAALAVAIEKVSAELAGLKQKVADSADKKPSTLTIGDESINLGDESAVRGLVAKLVADNESLKKDVMTPDERDARVQDWADMLETAKKIAPSVDTKGKTCHQIRIEALKVAVADESINRTVCVLTDGKDIDGLDLETAKKAFKLASTLIKPAQDVVKERVQVGDAALGAKKESGSAVREAYLDHVQNAWKTTLTKE